MNPDHTWLKIERFLENRTLIPIIGPGAITMGAEDRPLYPWLVGEMAGRLGLTDTPSSLHHLVCQCLGQGMQIEDICLKLDVLFGKECPEPGRVLRRLASVAQCRRFFTLGFDPLFERALGGVRNFGKSKVVPWEFSLDLQSADLPETVADQTTLGYLFGKVSANSGFHLWDADAVEFICELQRQLPALNTLGRTLAESNLLFIGVHGSDWLVRFLLRTLRQKPFSVATKRALFIADGTDSLEDDAVIFYDSLRRDVAVLPMDPVRFAGAFCDLAASLEPPLDPGRIPGVDVTVPLMEPATPDGSIFISYAHSDAVAAVELVERLRARGCLVWLDDDRLVCGDNFENNLEDAVKRHCGFFISVISETTEKRSEAYFHKERRWAAERSVSFAETRPFYFPIVIDGTSSPLRNEPRVFSKIDFERAPGGAASDAFCDRLAEIQRKLLTPRTIP